MKRTKTSHAKRIKIKNVYCIIRISSGIKKSDERKEES